MKNNRILIIISILFLFLLVGCGDKMTQLPNFDNLSLKEVKEKVETNDYNLTFEYLDVDTDNVINDNDSIFIKFGNDAKAGDDIGVKSTVKVYFKKGIKLPDLSGKSKEEIEQIFSELNMTLEYIYYYDEDAKDENYNKFYKYDDNLSSGDFYSGTSLKIIIKTNELTLPNLDGMDQEEIELELFKLGIDVDITSFIEFSQYYDPLVEQEDEDKFHSYSDGLKAGDVVKDLNKITIYLSVFDDVRLPNLRNLNREEIQNKLLEMGLDEKYYNIRVNEYNLGVNPSTFIRYGNGLRPGSKHIPSTNNKFDIYVDAHILLPDLVDLTKEQIISEFNKLNLTNVQFDYITNNDKEHDSFSSYLTHEFGEGVKNEDEIIINLYQNDNFDLYKLMFTKYIYISGEAKGVEIYNYGDKDINLKDYYIALLGPNDLLPYETITFNQILKPNEKLLLIDSKSSEQFKNKADIVSDYLDFHLLDRIQLRNKNNNTYFDTIYERGNSAALFDEEIFVRRTTSLNNTPVVASRDFVSRNWLGFIPTFINVLDSMPGDVPLSPEFELMDQTFPNYGMTKMEFIRAADGDTVYFKSLDSRDKNNYDGDNRIRFLMVDTPETEKPGQVGQQYAQVATNFTRTLLSAASEIYLQADRTAGLTETYGRTLGVIWFKLDNEISFNNIAASGDITISKGWHLLNYELLKHGLGVGGGSKSGEYYKAPIYSNRYTYQWAQEAVFYAQMNELGLYSGVTRW